MAKYAYSPFNVGAVVRIGRNKTTVVGTYEPRLDLPDGCLQGPGIPGGRVVDPPVQGFESWNIDAMTLITPAPNPLGGIRDGHND